MSAGTVVICGGILATVILLTIVAVLCYCRLQYYCCKREEPEREEEEQPELTTMSSLPTPVHAADAPGDTTTPPSEANGPTFVYTPPLVGKPVTRSHTFCPSCSRYSLPFHPQHPCDRLRNGGARISYRTVEQQELDLPVELASFNRKLNLIRSVTMREVVTHSVSTDV
ncbi:protein FAM163B [Esox lucius]|uniref:Family with sequence similarity 163 member B n=1 Tax=Esox lucius TaxID=8010 RepID=A0A3P8YFY3_ESOLU|nr:protein FAM163B [Esox lucius]XP_019908024.1 protein FAM163B [Esox lucius]XP_019908025.1 protein FAM163B [Esox lucius]XP_034152536.1 protein FAM163B [Esox lucius]